MTQSKYAAKIAFFAKKPVFTAADAKKAGIPSRMLSHFCKQGIIERISRGVYMGTQSNMDIEFQWEDLARVVLSIPKGVICLISALCYHDLTDQIMREFWIAVPHASKSPRRPKTRVVRMRNIDLGQTEVQMGECFLKIFDRERTVIDAFRFLSQEVAIKALQAYLRPSKTCKPDLKKLMAYAKQLRVNIDPYILTLTTRVYFRNNPLKNTSEYSPSEGQPLSHQALRTPNLITILALLILSLDLHRMTFVC